MSEITVGEAVFDHATAITTALDSWLRAEVTSSIEGRNQVLDDWDRFHVDGELPFSDPSNQSSSKALSHFNRLENWTAYAQENSDALQDDYFLARQMFCAQMFISGAFRKQCFLQSGDADEYFERRQNGPVDIDLRRAISRRWAVKATDGSEPISAEELSREMQATNQACLGKSRRLHKRTQESDGQVTSWAVGTLKIIQKAWTLRITDHVLFASQRPGKSFESVPWLEPRSISDDPQIYFPFGDKPVAL